MGRDKARIEWTADRSGPTAAGQTSTGPTSTGRTSTSQSWAERAADLLSVACPVVLEVGPGYTALPPVRDAHPGEGPLAAVAAGWAELTGRGWSGPVLVVATDLPRLTLGLIEWLAHHPAERSVVPLADGRLQPLCARYQPDDLDLAARLVAQGARSMIALVDACDPIRPDERDWLVPAGDPAVFRDADTPADLERLEQT